MSVKNANNNAENAKNGKAAKSMTKHYTLGHKAVAVAMSTVMLGFGMPVNAPQDAYADTDTAAEQQAEQDSVAKKSEDGSSQKKTESTKAADSSSTKADSASINKASSGSSSAKEATKAETKTTADVALSLGNASVKYQGQTIAAPASKVTVPTKNDFKFTVAADNGYDLTRVTLKVSGKESTLTADASGTYTVAAADVLAGASLKLATEHQVQAQPVADTTPIEDTEAEDVAAIEQPVASEGSAANNEQQGAGDANAQENVDESVDQQGGEETSGDEGAAGEERSDEQAEESNESDAAQLQALGNQLISLFAANGDGDASGATNGLVSGPTTVMLGESIDLTLDSKYEVTGWYANGPVVLENSDGTPTDNGRASTQTVHVVGKTSWSFNGESTTATINCQYKDGVNQWSTSWVSVTLTVIKRPYTVEFPAVADDENHYVMPILRDGLTGEVLDIDGISFTLDFYKDGEWIGNTYNHGSSDFYGPGKYTAVLKPHDGWMYYGDGKAEIPNKNGEIAAKEFVADNPNDVACDGKEHKWAPKVTDSTTGEELTEGTDYELIYDNNDFVNPGTITVTIKGLGAYKDCTDSKTYHILQLSIEGEDTVEQFKSIDLTAKVNPDVDHSSIVWASSDESIAIIDANGKVKGLKEGTVTITATTTTTSGVKLTATHQVTVTKSTAEASDAYLFFQASPTANLESNVSGDWYPFNGCSGHASAAGLKVKLDTEGVDWKNVAGGKTSHDVTGRVTEWPDGSSGDSYELPKDNQYWEILFNAWKSQLEKEQNTSITKADVDSITLIPYKMAYNTNNGGGHYHLDCKVEVKCHKAITALFYLKDAGSSTDFVQYGEGVTYKLENGIASVQAPAGEFPDVKEVDGVQYKFNGWYSDRACTHRVTFPVAATGNVSFYAKYVPMDQTMQVNYYLEGTTTSVAPSKTLAGLTKGQTVTQDPLDVPGYTPVSSESKAATAGTDSEINFYYRANEVNYTVDYLWNGTDEKIAESDTIGGSHIGEVVTVAQRDIDGYTVVPDQGTSIKLDIDESKNVIKVYYYKNVDLTANSDAKEYTGEEQSVSGFTGAPEGADFSKISVGAKGTDAGTYDAKFPEGTVGIVDGSGKYIVSKANDGKLTITRQSINPDDDDSYLGIRISDPSDAEYNGSAHVWVPEVTDKDGNVLIEGVDYTVTYPAGQDFTNVTGAIPATITGMGNYAGSVAKSYQITPAELTITTGSAEKQYDGTALTNGDLEIAGLVPGDAVTAHTTGSQTEVGSSANTYEINWGKVRSSNYAISEVLGMLTVTEAAAPTPVTPDTPGADVAPNNGGTTPTAVTTNPVLDNVARVLENGYNAVTGSNEAGAAVAAGEQIFDDENPLGTTTYEEVCWVHFYIILGMILSGIYGLGVMFRRFNHIRRLRNDMNDVMGNGDGSDAEKAPAATQNPAGMEA